MLSSRSHVSWGARSYRGLVQGFLLKHCIRSLTVSEVTLVCCPQAFLVMPCQPIHPVHWGVWDLPLWQHFEMFIIYLSFSSPLPIFPFAIGRCKQFSWHNRETLNFVLVRWLDFFLGHLLAPHVIIGRSFLLALLCIPWLLCLDLWVWPCGFVLFRWSTARLQQRCDSARLVSCYTSIFAFYCHSLHFCLNRILKAASSLELVALKPFSLLWNLTCWLWGSLHPAVISS